MTDLKKTSTFLLAILFLSAIFYTGIYIITKRRHIRGRYKDCNIIIITLNLLRRDALSCYGAQTNASPNIDSFSKEAIVFDRAYSAESYTIPSLTSVLTSLYPFFHKINYFTRKRDLNKNIHTLPEILKEHGFRTLLFDPVFLNEYTKCTTRGFDKIYRSEMLGNKVLEKLMRNNRNRKFFIFDVNLKLHMPYFPDENSILKISDRFKDRRVISRDYLVNKMKNKILKDPSILFKNTEFKRQRDHMLSLAGTQRTVYLNTILRDKNVPELKNIFNNLVDKSFLMEFNTRKKEDLEYLKAVYNARLLEVDRNFGTFIGLLKKYDILDNSIIVLMSGHGEAFMEHGLIEHSTLHKEITNVPLLIRLPGAKDRGLRIKEPVSLVDIMPTLLKLTDIPSPSYLQGKYMFRKSLFRQERPILSEHFELEKGKISYNFSIIFTGYQYIARFVTENALLKLRKGSEELYDMKDYEQNIIDSDQNKAVSLRERLEKEYIDMQEKLWNIIPPTFRFSTENKK